MVGAAHDIINCGCWLWWCGCPAGRDYYCPDGLVLYNDGNTPLLLAALSGSALLPDGSPCRHNNLQPGEAAFCDIAWRISQPELELGATFVSFTVQGNDTGSSPATRVNATFAASVPVPQAPAMTVKLEQAYPAGGLGAGTLWILADLPLAGSELVTWDMSAVFDPVQRACSIAGGCCTPGDQGCLHHCFPLHVVGRLAP